VTSATARQRWGIGREADLTRLLLEARRVAEELGFGPVAASAVVTVVSELGRNILKYAGRGHVLLRPLAAPRAGIEIVVQDRGPGIEDLDAALRDHVSTSGTLGLGLPGVRRLVDEFAIETTAGEGTTVTVRKWLA
jgi:serine/threonine-protein kinase RsbT